MAEGTLSILLRNGTHAAATKRLALKCDNISIQLGRTPIQVPIPTTTPQLIDLGTIRPTISCAGLVDTVGGDTTNTSDTAEVRGMASFSYNDGSSSQTYFIPYKNYLEQFICEELYSSDKLVQVQIGDPSVGIGSSASGFSTGGSIYECAVQSCNFTLVPGFEDRYQFALQFVAKTANHVFD